MVKSVAVNPKVTVIRKVLAKARPVLLRGIGQIGRSLVSPKTAVTEAAKLEASLGSLMAQELSATKEAVVRHDADIPATGGAWVMFPLSQQRNASRGMAWCGPALLYVKDGRPLAGGFLLGDMEEPVIVCAGEGVSGQLGRCRVSGRTDLLDAMVSLPLNSGDGASLKLLELGDEHTFHTRKTGSPFYDLWMVATGMTDVMVATRARPMEAMLIELTMRECGGTFARVGSALVAGTPKVQAELAKLLG